ncbi:MAG TPA: DUF1552 domain-containing protein [Gemmataceae bacterium]|jgi:hypothetical protein|nr:DUF1552 domain-containing protein [Gemmataceae bacterium]
MRAEILSRVGVGVSRRAFLRGVGACVALPLFESLRPTGLFAAELPPGNLACTQTGAPLRTAFLYFPNGAIPAAWWPTGAGAEFQWSRTLKPLEKQKGHVQILAGLDDKPAEPGADGAGDHARGNGTFLTGVRLKKSATDIRAGVSIDQVLAKECGHLTRFPSLELTCDAAPRTGGCDSGYSCAYQFNLSWSSATTPKSAESNPRRVFERLFGDGKPGERAANLRRRLKEDQSVLDFVMDDARTMQKRLNLPDRQKLDQYLTGVREIETQIQKAEHFGKTPDPGIETPAGVPADYAAHMQLMFDMLVLAFQTDSTRIATLLLAHDGSNRSFDQIGISEGHHDLTHHQNRKDRIDKVADIDLWYVQQFARFLDKLNQVKDADGKTLLHNSIIVYGSGNADGNRHTHANLPILLAGAGGGALNSGRYVNHGAKPLTSLYVSLAHLFGVSKLEQFGDSGGPLANL